MDLWPKVKKLKVAFARPNSKDIQNANLYITNLPLDYTDNDLRKLFDGYGDIVECRILNDIEGKSRGVGFVRMSTHLNAVNALQARDNYIINPNLPPITVKLAQRRMPKRILQLQKQNNMRYKTNYSNNNNNANNNDNGRQPPNRRYVRQQNNQMQNNNDNNYNRNNNRRQQPHYRQRNNMNNQMYNNRQQYNHNLRNAPMYDNMNDFAHSQYPPMYPQYYDANASFNPAMNMNMGSGINNNQQMPMNLPQSKLNNHGVPNSFNVIPNGSINNNKNNNNNNASSTFNIIVNNLPDYYNVDHLIQLFAPYGPIQSVNIQKPTSSNQTTTGIISYFYFDDAQKAQSQTNGRRLDSNQRLEVTFQPM